MKLFLEVASTGNYYMIALKDATPEECFGAWEAMVDKINIASGTREFTNILNLKKAYNSLLREYNRVKSALYVCCMEVNQEMIAFLKSRGYPLNISSTESYSTSLNLQLRRSENLITRINMKYKQIENIGENQVGVDVPTFDSIMAGLMAAKITVDDSITVVRYNALRKIMEDNERVRARTKNK